MSKAKLNAIVAEYNKLRSKAKQVESQEKPSDEAKESPEAQEMESKLGVEKHDKPSGKLDFSEEEAEKIDIDPKRLKKKK